MSAMSSARGYRSGHCNRNLAASSGAVTLKIPKLKGIFSKPPFLSGTTAGKAVWKRP